MKDEDIGKICEICNIRDYVPFKCKNCNKIVSN